MGKLRILATRAIRDQRERKNLFVVESLNLAPALKDHDDRDRKNSMKTMVDFLYSREHATTSCDLNVMAG